MHELGFLSIFPNVCVAFCIFLTLPVSVASAERSFSKLKKVKNFHRSTMSQERLNGVAMPNINSDLSRRLDFSSIITIFTATNARKAFLQLNLMFNHWNHCFYFFSLTMQVDGCKCVIYKKPENTNAAWASLGICEGLIVVMLSLKLDNNKFISV